MEGIFGQGSREGRLEGRKVGRQKGRQLGRKEGRQEGELELALRQRRWCCGELSPEQVNRDRALPLELLEELAEALLDFRGVGDLEGWLAAVA